MTARLWFLTGCLVLAATLMSRVSTGEILPPRQPFSAFPVSINGWQGDIMQPFDPAIVRILGVDDYVNRVYRAPGRPPVGLYAGYYKSQREGDTIHSPLNCLPGSGWEPMIRERVSLQALGSSPFTVNELVIEKGIERQLVIYWYQSHGRVIASEYSGRAFLALDALRLNRTDGSMIRVIVPIDDRGSNGIDIAKQAAQDFARVIFKVLPDFVPA